MTHRLRLALAFALAMCCAAVTAHAQTLDQYGGWTGLKGHNTSGYFRTEKINGRYWLVTPDNNVFWSIGSDWIGGWDWNWIYEPATLTYSPLTKGLRAKYGNDKPAWASATQSRLQSWGFNTIAGCSELAYTGSEAATILDFVGVALSRSAPMVNSRFPDVFNTAWDQACDQACHNAQVPARATNRYTIGYYNDNELPWNTEFPRGGQSMADNYITLPATYAGKQYWVNTFLKGRYATLAALNSAYGTSYTSWTGTEGTSVVNCTSLNDDSTHPARYNDKLDFMTEIATRYFSVGYNAVKRYDTNHLIMGDRLSMNPTSGGYTYQTPFYERIWSAATPYIDIYTVNCYYDSFNQWDFPARVFAKCKRPLMIAENDYWGCDTLNLSPWWNNTQTQRGQKIVSFVKGLMDSAVTSDPNDGQPAKTVIGWHMFAHYDQPPLGNLPGENMNTGLLNVKDEPYLPLVDALASAYSQLYTYMAQGQAFSVPNAPGTVRPVLSSIAASATVSSGDNKTVLYPNGGSFYHARGSLVDDTEATGGKAWKATVGETKGWMQYGPYAAASTLIPGSPCTVTFRLKTNSNTSTSTVAKIDVATENGATVRVSRDIKGTDFTAANTYQDFTLALTIPASSSNTWEYRAYFSNVSDISVDTTTVNCVSLPGTACPALADNSPYTSWKSQAHTSATATEWVVLDFGSVQSQVNGLTITPGSTAASGMPADFRLEYSADGTNWSTVPDQSYTNFPNPGGKVSLSFAALSARYLRLYATKLGADEQGAYRLHIADVQSPLYTGTSWPTFEWSPVAGAASYTLLISPEKCFPQEQTLRVDGITGTSCTPTLPTAPGRWYWCVRAVDAQGRGGYYSAATEFQVGGLSNVELNTAQNLKCERATAWKITDNEATNGDGTVWVFRDSTKKYQGSYSTQLVFTANSLNRTLSAKNTGAAAIPCRMSLPRVDMSNNSSLKLRILPALFCNTSGNLVPASKFLHVKVTNSDGTVVADRSVDPSGTFSTTSFTQVDVPLTGTRNQVSELQFYVNCGEAGLTWDARLVCNIDDISLPPATPTVTDSGPFTTDLKSLRASWISSDPVYGITEYRYAIGTVPMGSNVVAWQSVGLTTSINRTNMNLAHGRKYYISVKATNGENVISAIGVSDGIVAVDPKAPSTMRSSADGALVILPCVVVTADPTQLAGVLYVQELNGTNGIKVQATPAGVETGDYVAVTGTIGTANGERVITNASVTPLM